MTDKETIEKPTNSCTEISATKRPVNIPQNSDIESVKLESSSLPDSSQTPDNEPSDEIYNRVSPSRKRNIVALLSFCSFLTTISSTSILSATPEVASTYNATNSIIDLSNGLYLLFSGLSPCLWGLLSQVYGRRLICITLTLFFTAFFLGTALAPNISSFFIFRILTACEGTPMLIIGSACISDIYRPSERATAIGWFFSGTLIGPALGPFIGGVIVTYTSWRVIFYLQAALAGAALISTIIVLPETIHRKKSVDLANLPLREKARILFILTNPWRVIKLFRYPNLLLVGLATSSLMWNMYSLSTPIRDVLNPRFNLTTPILSGLFYLAPGCGHIFGTFFGGRWADHITKRWIQKRGYRIPEDRLRSHLPFMGVIIPICMLLYGFSIQYRFGGIALPVIAMFVQGVAQIFCFPSLNTYCLDVIQERAAEVIAGNYLIRFLFAAIGSAVVLPAVEEIGVGWFSCISAGCLVLSTLGTAGVVRWG
ncbi:hypothetical protein HYALB_00006972 [Hymenoscyphus albidus]|uniref:Major facilitator superfamily (MFS) profile domain-containing protein n=1 Tax=Hymenoscyphus albidus TaxID=595503 RepID=A0A9N9LLI5_9HELO|nr:hypothetical protein HYALB_00006972 [Hymenoscyphus albidus]